MGMWSQISVHRFVYQSARHGSSGRASTAKFHVFSARVFLDKSQNIWIHKINIILRQNSVWGRGWGSGGDWGQGWGLETGLGGLGPGVPGGML